MREHNFFFVENVKLENASSHRTASVTRDFGRFSYFMEKLCPFQNPQSHPPTPPLILFLVHPKYNIVQGIGQCPNILIVHPRGLSTYTRAESNLPEPEPTVIFLRHCY